MLLLRFGLENFASFRDPTEVSFVSTSQADEPELRFSSPHTPHGVLPVIGLWGPNASGKTNLVEALWSFRQHVRFSFTDSEPDSPIPWRPFAMCTGEDGPPTRMEVDIIAKGVRYHYGMAFTANGFVEEWLYFWPNSRRQVIFHRDHREEDPWYFGPSLKGPKRTIAKATRPNSLFLSCAAQFNHDELKSIYSEISGGIVMERLVMLRGYPLFDADSVVVQPQFKELVLQFLAAADVGVVDLEVRQHTASANDGLDKILNPDFLKRIRAQEEEQKLEIHLTHGESDGTRWTLDPSQESRGTWVLLRRLEDILSVLQDGGVVLFDELDMSLHPELGAALVQLFVNKEVNKNEAQLLFSTHNRSLMNGLRRDEVVLVDKARDGSSSLRAASEYSVRSRDDLRRAYEQGRVRGVPVLGDFGHVLAEGVGG